MISLFAVSPRTTRPCASPQVVVRREPITVLALGTSCTNLYAGKKGPQPQLFNWLAYDPARWVGGWLAVWLAGLADARGWLALVHYLSSVSRAVLPRPCIKGAMYLQGRRARSHIRSAGLPMVLHNGWVDACSGWMRG